MFSICRREDHEVISALWMSHLPAQIELSMQILTHCSSSNCCHTQVRRSDAPEEKIIGLL